MLSINTPSQLVAGYLPPDDPLAPDKPLPAKLGEQKGGSPLAGLENGHSSDATASEDDSKHAAVESSGPSWNLLNIKMGRSNSATMGADGTLLTSAKKLRHKKSAKGATTKTLKAVKDTGVNLRDVGATTNDEVREGALFRSSELLGKKQMEQYGIKTILDLRRMDRPCKNKKDNKLTVKLKTAWNYMMKGSNMVVPDVALPFKARAFPKTCDICSERFEDRYGLALHVQHADLIPGLVGFRIFQAMPKRVRFQAILAGLRGQGAASVMAPAVADPLLMGYKALYKTVLEDSKRGIARAMRVFADPENFPVLVHCIHGKDRTGLVIALLLMLCDVNPQIIVKDYVQSEEVLKASRMHDELDLDVYLTSNDVIAATKDTMEDTIAFINDKYGSARKYLKSVGLENQELAQIRINLMKQAGVQDLLLRGKAPRVSTLGRLSRSGPSQPGSRLPHRNTYSVMLPAIQEPRAQRQRSIRVPGETEVHTLHPRPRSADLGTRSMSSVPSEQRSQHTLSQPSPVSPRGSLTRNSMFGGAGRLLSRSTSHPQEVIREAAGMAPPERSHSPTGGRFTAGWVPEAAEQQQQQQEAAQAQAEQEQEELQQQQAAGSEGDLRRRSGSVLRKRLSRPSNAHPKGSNSVAGTRRFEDLDTPKAGAEAGLALDGDSASSFAGAQASAAGELHEPALPPSPDLPDRAGSA